MRAAVFHGPGDLRLETVPEPAIAEDELLLKVEACALCGSDVRTYRFGAANISGPVITGHEIAGTVAAVGRRLDGFAVGQGVAVAPAIPCGACGYCRAGAQTVCDQLRSIGYQFDGGFAEYMAVPASAVRAGCVNTIPPGLTFEEAALAEPLACVLNAQEIVGVGADDTVLVMGAGPVGCLHAGLARARQARKVILVDIQQRRLELARGCGADCLVDGAAEPVAARVAEETGGGASVVIVATPAKAAHEQAVALAAKRGRVSLFAGLPKTDPLVSLDANLVHYRELSLSGAYGSTPAQNRAALELLASGRVRASHLISQVVPLEQIRDAIGAVEKGRVLKVVVRP